VREFRVTGVNVGIGTDGAHCSDNQNMFEAMRMASFVSRARDHDPTAWLATGDVLEMATAGSARALGFGDDIGRIAPGAHADIVFLDLGHLNWWPLNDPVNQIVHTEDAGAVDGVMVGGETVLWGGRFTRIDMAAVRAQVDAAAEQLRRLNHDRRELAGSLEDAVGRFCLGLARQPHHVHAMASAAELRR
jgi:guanine deaminase